MLGTTIWLITAICCMIAVQSASAGESNEQYVQLIIYNSNFFFHQYLTDFKIKID